LLGRLPAPAHPQQRHRGVRADQRLRMRDRPSRATIPAPSISIPPGSGRKKTFSPYNRGKSTNTGPGGVSWCEEGSFQTSTSGNRYGWRRSGESPRARSPGNWASTRICWGGGAAITRPMVRRPFPARASRATRKWRHSSVSCRASRRNGIFYEKRQRSSRKNRSDVPHDRPLPRRFSRPLDVLLPAGFGQRLLRLARPSCEPSQASESTAAGSNPKPACAKRRRLRDPSDVGRAALTP